MLPVQPVEENMPPKGFFQNYHMSRNDDEELKKDLKAASEQAINVATDNVQEKVEGQDQDQEVDGG